MPTHCAKLFVYVKAKKGGGVAFLNLGGGILIILGSILGSPLLSETTK